MVYGHPRYLHTLCLNLVKKRAKGESAATSSPRPTDQTSADDEGA